LVANQRKLAARKRQWLLVGLLSGTLLLFTGCRTLGFYRQAFAGQWEILTHQRKNKAILADPQTSPELRRQLELLEQIREFAVTGLGLPADGHYRSYVDLKRPFVVWNVEAAREFSLEPKRWWYPFLGRLDYRGYFRKDYALKYAEDLRADGYEVDVGGVQAYSTLGWFKDPLLNTFLFLPDTDLAELIFHELGHQVAFAHGDTDFNEAFATCVGQEGVRRWLQKKGDPQSIQRYEISLQRNVRVVRLILESRARLEHLYGDQRGSDGRIKSASPAIVAEPSRLRDQKRAILDQLRQEYGRLKEAWEGYNDYDGFFSRDLNNAQLNSIANYYGLVPGFESLLNSKGGDLRSFYAAVQALADKKKTERREQLRAFTASSPLDEQVGN